MFNKDQYIKDLEQLVSLDCGSFNPKGVKKVINILDKTFKELNFITEEINVSKENLVGPLFIAYNKPSVNYYDVLLVGHADTVYEQGLVNKHPMRIEGNKCYGLGSIDMKSGILNIIYTLKNFTKEELDGLSIAVLINPDEEISSIYSGETILQIAKKAKCALIMESPGEDGFIVNSRKGIARYTVKFYGKAAHASAPSDGASAINELANFIVNLKELASEDLQTTYNVNPIKCGNSAGNVIADYAECSFETRFFSNEDYNSLHNKILSYVNNPQNKNIKVELRQISYKAPLKNYTENKWIEEIAVNAAKKVGLNVELLASAGGSDGNEISSIGIPTIDGLGPIGEYWHNADLECLFMDSIEPRIKFTTQLLKDIKARNG